MSTKTLVSTITVPQILQDRAQQWPDKSLFIFLKDGDNEKDFLTYGQLDQQARGVATLLQSYVAPGARILLMYPPGLAYITAFFGCLYAGCIPVPVYPPRNNRSIFRLQKIAADSQASIALAPAQTVSKINNQFSKTPVLNELNLLSFSDDITHMAAGWHPPQINEDSLAFLQYTSGSTAAPKGVMLTHQNLLHNSALIQQCFGTEVDQVGVFWLPPYHDMGLIGGILHPIYCGGTSVLMSPIDFITQPFRWLKAMTQFRATISSGPNFAYDLCVDKISPDQRKELDLSNWQVAINGAEPVRPGTLEQFAKAFEPYGFRREAFKPTYGLAEATLLVSGIDQAAPPTFYSIDRADLKQNIVTPALQSTGKNHVLVGCGYPQPGQEIVIVNPETHKPCPANQVGEIWVSGASVAKGYWQKPEKTVATFHAQLADNHQGAFLRTGDLGFIRQGELFVTGRIKDLIIIQGRNHYPEDIEFTVDRCHPALQPYGNAAFSVDLDGHNERLVVVQEVRRTELRDANLDEIITTIRQAILREHDLSVHAITLVKPSAIPKTSSGKVQRFACRNMFLEGSLKTVAEWTQGHTASNFDNASFVQHLSSPHTPVETALVEIWQDVLGTEQININDDFFQWGGHSLMATQVISRIREVFAIEVPLESMFKEPTIAGLAKLVETSLQDGQLLKSVEIGPVPRNQALPTTFSQERMWFVQQLQPDNSAYNIVLPLRIKGPLNKPALTWSLNELIRRHESLRTVIALKNGVPRQIIQPQLTITPTETDLRSHRLEQREAKALQLASAEAARPFNLAQGPLIRAVVLRLAEEDFILQFTIHHAVFDAWSVGVFGRELCSLYEARIANKPGILPNLPIQYADFAYWQRHWFQGKTLAMQLTYWRQELKNVPVLALPTDHPRPPVQNYHGTFQSIEPDPALFKAISTLSRRRNVTPFMTFLAAFQTLLHRYTHQTDFAIGTPIANRHHLASENLIGTLVNTLVIRADLSEDPTFNQLLDRVRQKTLKAYAHQDLPFEKLVLETNLERDLSHAPLFQVMLDYINVPVPDQHFADLSYELIDVDRRGAQFDLTLAIVNTNEIKRMSIEYNTELFDAATIKRFFTHYQTLLSGIIANPDTPVSELPILPDTEAQTLLADWNQTTFAYPQNSCIHQLFEVQAAKTPDAVAVVFNERTITYRELNSRANQLAHYLQWLGVTTETPVGISMERCPEMVIGLLGILKAGGTYIPLDPHFPPARLAYMVEDSQARIVLTQHQLTHQSIKKSNGQLICLDSDWETISRQPTHAPATPAQPHNLAYIIYTSGSTGKPKGVQLSHQNAVNFLCSMQREPGLTARDKLFAVTTLSFDISVLEIFLPLITGAQTIIASGETIYDGRAMIRSLAQHRPTIMQATPATWRMLIEAGWQGDAGLKVLCGGEAMPYNLATWLVAHTAEVWNMYGPTETTVWSTLCQITANTDHITVGRPIANTQIYILDKNMAPTPIGVAGELYIAGDGVARGYLNQAELTAEKFVIDPFSSTPGAKMYRTGDQARYLPDGQIEFLGRIDFQVKVRGFRIELGEIESVLTQHPDVKQAVVIVREDSPGDKRLVAYLIPEEKSPLRPNDLRQFMTKDIPEYMVPSFFVFLDEFPLTPNRKIDRLALPAPDTSSLPGRDNIIAPRTPTEETLAAIWREILEIDEISTNDNFFDLGGHSLLAVHLFTLIDQRLGVNLPLMTLFQNATIAEMAALIDKHDSAQAWSSLVEIEPQGSAPPFFCIHGITGDVLWFRDLARCVAPHIPFYGIQARGLDGIQPLFDDVQSMAAYYVEEIRRFQPNGPYHLGGASFGGTVALEMAQQLRAQGEKVALLAIFDHAPPNVKIPADQINPIANFAGMIKNIPHWVRESTRLGPAQLWARFVRKTRLIGRNLTRSRYDINAASNLIDYAHKLPDHRQKLISNHHQIFRNYTPQPYPDRVTLLRARSRPLFCHFNPKIVWQQLSPGRVDVREIPGSHEGMFKEPHVKQLAKQFKDCFDQAQK